MLSRIAGRTGNTSEDSEGEAGVQEDAATADTPVSAAAEDEGKDEDVAENTELTSSATENSVNSTKEPEDGEAGREASPPPLTLEQ
ncbi:hypothetical protein EPR50_G00184950 [Perca flavescens]|uniref:Uncharacterized protein n=1 Tax=Perca flavescens TaxID=8167 RepID=A0A484CEG7_PERFV|nr:hypothetical protein EPR50_G00184950 [Perca flavescens]